MDNELMVFQNPEFGEIRAIEINGEQWFAGKDIAIALGYAKPTDAVRKLVDEEDRKRSKMEIPSGIQEMTIINEGGLYSLVMSSTLPNAKKFKRWVTHEVLPSLRSTGSYSLQPQQPMTPAELLAAQANLLVDLERRTSAIEQKVDRALTAMARPEADTWVEDMKEAIRAYCEAAGLADAAGRGRLYAALDREAKCSTDARLRRMRERKKKVGETRRNYMALTKLDAIAADGKLRTAFEGIVARETARAAVK